MKITQLMVLVSAVTLLAGCASTPPQELVKAREAYQRASTGETVKVAPAEVHVAELALKQAEESFKKDSNSTQTRDLAYVAQRKSELAEAAASINIEQAKQTQAKTDYRTTQGKIIADTKQDLSQANTALAESERSGEMTAAQLSAEQLARADAEQRAAAAQAALANLAAVRNDPRGMVITLSGSVIFASNKATLLPAAQTRLNQVANVLLTTRERNLIVEGHTDSQGTNSYNQNLSQRRANAVRKYLVQRGYDANLVQATGLGEGQPVADNSSPEGRANNRRVEIIILRDANAPM